MKQKIEKAKIIEISKLERGTSQNGDWQKITIVVERFFQSEWGEPQSELLALTAFGSMVDKILDAVLQVGDIIDVGCNCYSRSFNHDNKGKIWNTQIDLVFFKVIWQQHTEQPHAASEDQPTIHEMPPVEQDAKPYNPTAPSGLPF